MTAVLLATVTLVLLGATPWWAAERAGLRRVRGLRAGPSATGAADGAGALDLGVVLELLAAALRAGASIPRALDAVGAAIGGRDGAVLVRVGADLLAGLSWEDAWRGHPAHTRALGVVAEALQAAWEHGAAPADALRVAQAEARRRAGAHARLAAGRLGVHLVLPLGLCYLPAFVLVGVVPILLSLGAGVLG